MTVPTITSIDPTSGSTKGTNIVFIHGTNFRLPPAPPENGFLGGEAQQTVNVMFDGVLAPSSQAASAELITATVPTWTGPSDTLPSDVDVRVANLDDSGVEIPTENATLVDGYNFHRVQFVSSFVHRVCEMVVQTYRTHVLEKSFHTMSRDYVGSIAFLERLQADVPSLYIIGPSLRRDGLRTMHTVEPYEDPGDAQRFIRKVPPVAVDLMFDLRVYANKTQHILAAQQALLTLFRDVPYLYIDDQQIEHRLPFGEYPRVSNTPNQSDLKSISGRMEIKGVQIDDENGTIQERGAIIFDNDGVPILETQTT